MLSGRPISVRDRAQLKVHRGKLLWGCAKPGIAVHAASFLRRREIILATELLARPKLFRFILVHELFHFVWPRLSNHLRADFSELLRRERAARSRGELGESSCFKKERLGDADLLNNSIAWRDYVCETFCDTAAWLYSGLQRHSAFTLAKRWRERRGKWFKAAFHSGCRC